MRGSAYRLTVLAAIVFVILIGAAVAVGAIVRGLNASSTPLATAVLGIIATAIPSLLALLKVEQAHTELTKQNGRIGALEEHKAKAK